MSIETIHPRDERHWHELRAQDITSTEVSALFGISPYLTEFELWHRKKDGAIVTIDQNERMLWGDRLQDAIANGIASDQGWKIRRMSEYIRTPLQRMGASFDYEIDTNGDGPAGLLEIKNVDSLAFRQGWIENDSGIEAPPHIEIQVQHQLAVSERRFAYIGALVGGNRLGLIRRERNKEQIEIIMKRVLGFWHSIRTGREPTPDFARDAEFISRLYGSAEKGKFFDARKNDRILNLVREYRGFADDIKALDAKRAEIKAEILATVGDCEKVLGEGFSISAGVVAATRVEAFDKKSYRNFRVNYQKETP